MSKHRYHIQPATCITNPLFGECEWETWIGGSECYAIPSRVIVDTEDRYDPSYPEGFHFSHLCAEHGESAMRLLENA